MSTTVISSLLSRRSAAKRRAPSAADDLLRLSAIEIARRIRDGELTSRAVVLAHVARVRAVNPRLNAVVAARFEQALAEADRADAAVRAGARLPPLHGVPCTIKESFAVAGMPHSAGLVARARRDVRADADAITVARIRAAGAIPLGVTNVSELCMWMESNNRVYGRSSNPYDARRIVGGSSGGEGAIVGAGGSPFGLGSDVGGSIRMPAFFNGVFGHKPTWGVVPNSGQFPMPDGEGNRLLGTGPLARRACDLMPILRLLAGPDGADPHCRPVTLGDPASVDLSALRVIDVEDDGRTPVTRELRAAQRKVAEHLRARGATVVRERIPAFRRALELWAAAMDEGSATTFSELLGEGEPVAVWTELARCTLRRSPYTLPALALAVAEKVIAKLPDQSARFLAMGEALRREVADRVGPNGVILYPPYARTAPRHGAPLLRPLEWVYTAIFNVLGFPVTQVPLGLDRGGLPLGVQVAAVPENDHVTIAVAMELERAFGGWVLPSD